MNLYELSAAYQEVVEEIEAGGDHLEDTLESLEDAIEDKAENYAKVMKNIGAQIDALKDEEKRLSQRRKSLENNISRMKKTLQDTMIYNDKRKIKTDLFSINIQKNPPSMKVTSEELIPKRFYIEQEPKLDRKSIIKELKETEVPGVELYQGESLRIR